MPIFKCNANDCTYSTLDRTKFKNHTDTHLPKEHQCRSCNWSFRTNSALQQHVEKMHGHFPCEFCHEAFGSLFKKETHIRYYFYYYWKKNNTTNLFRNKHSYGPKKITCTLCGESFSSQEEITHHTKTAHRRGGKRKQNSRNGPSAKLPKNESQRQKKFSSIIDQYVWVPEVIISI